MYTGYSIYHIVHAQLWTYNNSPIEQCMVQLKQTTIILDTHTAFLGSHNYIPAST